MEAERAMISILKLNPGSAETELPQVNYSVIHQTEVSQIELTD